MSTNRIGLNTQKAQQLAEQLNGLLANYQIFYMNVRGFHWNLKGQEFFQLHVKFEELYTELLEQVDEIAERVQTLGYQPAHAYSDYIKNSKIDEVLDVTDGKTCAENVLSGYKVLIEIQRDILSAAADADDEGTAALMGDYITGQEKTVWMFSSYLDK